VNLLEYFEKERSEENCNYLGVYCEVDYPEQSDIAFNIHSFGEENPSPDQTSKWVKTGQVDVSTFGRMGSSTIQTI
jgi:hypothetical protein